MFQDLKPKPLKFDKVVKLKTFSQSKGLTSKEMGQNSKRSGNNGSMSNSAAKLVNRNETSRGNCSLLHLVSNQVRLQKESSLTSKDFGSDLSEDILEMEDNQDTIKKYTESLLCIDEEGILLFSFIENTEIISTKEISTKNIIMKQSKFNKQNNHKANTLKAQKSIRRYIKNIFSKMITLFVVKTKKNLDLSRLLIILSYQ